MLGTAAHILGCTASLRDTEELREQLQTSLCSVLENPTDRPELRATCDRVIRACIQRLGSGLGEAHRGHLTSLLRLAELASDGHRCSAGGIGGGSPLYLERLLFHLLRSACSCGLGPSCGPLSERLLSGLSACLGREEEVAGVGRSAFALLWGAASSLAPGPGLSLRLRALPFLAPEPSPSPLLQRFIQACRLYLTEEGGGGGESRGSHLVLETQGLLGVLLKGPRPHSPGGGQLRPLLACQLALQAAAALSRNGCPSEARRLLSAARALLRQSGEGEGGPFLTALRLSSLSPGLRSPPSALAQPLARALGALRSLGADAGSLGRRALADGCGFLLSGVRLAAGGGGGEKAPPLRTEELLQLAGFLHVYLEQEMSSFLDTGSLKLCYQNLEFFTRAVYDFLLEPQDEDSDGAVKLLVPCKEIVEKMVELEEDLVAQGQTDYVGATALRLYNLAYGFYCRKLFSEAVQVAVVFRGRAQPPDLFARSSLPPDRVPRFYKLLVQCYRKLGSLESAMETVAMWLMALGDRNGEELTEPMALWACIKADTVKSGAEELQLRTLKDALQPWELEPGSLSALLLEELRAYKGLQGDTSRERFNVICDLLQLCSPDGRESDGEGASRTQQLRAVQLLELAQILCYRDMSQYTECSPMDCVEEALTILGSLPETVENRDQLLDDKAHAYLWRYVCDLEGRIRESVERSRRVGPVPEGVSEPEDGETNDLDYEERQHGAMSVHDCIDFNLSAENKRCESLDEALSLWKCLMAESPSPALRSAEQTAHAVHLMAALYRLMDKPFQVIESYGLMLRLLDPRTDSLPLTNVLLQLGETLLSVDCLDEVQTCLARAELLLKEDNSGKGDHHLLAKMTCTLLRSQLLWATSQVPEGLTLLLEVLTCPSLHKSSKAWYLLKAKVQQLVAAYLSLPPSALPATLRRCLQQHGWRSPESALTDAHKMLCGIVMLVCPGVLSFGKRSSELNCPANPGDNLFQKWLVLSNLLRCSGRLVSLLTAVGSAQEAKVFCLETLRLTARLHCVRPCAEFLVSSAELEMLRGDPQARDLDLRLVLHLLEPSADFLQERRSHARTRIRPRKARAPGPIPDRGKVDVEGEGGSSHRPLGCSTLPSPLRGRPLSQVETASLGRCASGSSASPPLGSRGGEASLPLPPLHHPDGCPCPVCGDPALTACCLRWALLLSRGARTGDVPRAVLSRCWERGAAFGLSLRGLAWQALGENGPEAHQAPHPGLFSWLEAQAYAQEAWLPPVREGDGRAWFASRPPGPWPLEHCRASALLASASRDWGGLSLHPGRGRGSAHSPRAPRRRVLREPGPALGKVGTAAPGRRGPRTRLRKRFDDSDPELVGEGEGEVPGGKGTVGPPPTTTTTGGRVRGKARGSRAERGQRRHRETEERKDRPETEAVDMQAVYSCLSEACSVIRHCPPSALYPRLCQLMALCLPRRDAYTTAFLLSESVAVTARHQMMQNLHRKSQKMRKERSQDVTEGLRGMSLRDDTPDPDCDPDPEPRARYISELESLFEFSLSDSAHWPQDDVQNFKEQLCMIPDDVTVCLLTLTSLSLSGDQTEMLLLTRLRKGRVPVTVRIPVRLSSLLSEFDAILAEQRDISNVTELKAWWDGRTALDRRMQGLVESMEKDALGCWKGLLLPGPRDARLDSEAAAICALLAHPGDCPGVDEELVKAMLGASHVLSDSDMRRIAEELCATDPRTVLLRLEAAVERLKSHPAGPSAQIVLILDKHLQRLPWESIPLLRALRVSRLPSFHFLLGYVVTKKHRVRSVLAEGVNPSSVYYVLNPQGNLPNTERTFKDWFRRRPGWEGVVGRGPSEEKLRSVLCNRDLYLYAGHGAGVRFLEGQEVQKLSCRAASLLVGCSSAALVLRGDLEGVGIVLKYMMAGCPLFLGNLWDVTDKDIDRYMENLLRGWLDAGSEASLLEYVAHARTAPKLKYLIGASPVVYGLSISLQ